MLPKPGFSDRCGALLARLSIVVLRVVPRYRRRLPKGAPHDFHGEAVVANWKDWALQYLQWHATAFPKSNGCASR
jgi:hypothetical protein